MDLIKIAYVVLHYKNAEVTIKCLHHLNSIMGDTSEVVVIDNFSQNNSLDKIKNAIGYNDKIHFICNSENLGFAKGNNLGYEFAKNKLHANCIIVMNNDIFIEDFEFEKKICFSELTHKYAIIAPDVITLLGNHQNPFRYKKIGTWKLFRGLCLQNIYAFVFQIGIMIPYIVQKYHNSGDVKLKKVCENIENIVPHGSCVIYTPNYIRNENFAFVPKTFFYGEEDMLFEYVMYRNYKTIYYPSIYVTHAEKQSTKSISNNELAILRFRSANKAKSLRICLKYRLFSRKFEQMIEK